MPRGLPPSPRSVIWGMCCPCVRRAPDADNHAVREAACHCIAELPHKVRWCWLVEECRFVAVGCCAAGHQRAVHHSIAPGGQDMPGAVRDPHAPMLAGVLPGRVVAGVCVCCLVSISPYVVILLSSPLCEPLCVCECVCACVCVNVCMCACGGWVLWTAGPGCSVLGGGTFCGWLPRRLPSRTGPAVQPVV
jgi:hypothetical protein